MRVIILGCGYLGYNLYDLLKASYDTELWGIESSYSSLVKDMKYINVFDQMAMAIQDLEDAVVHLDRNASIYDQAYYLKEHVISCMSLLRCVADELECIVDKSYWPFPTYSDLLFQV